jgi:hypothetical protein
METKIWVTRREVMYLLKKKCTESAVSWINSPILIAVSKLIAKMHIQVCRIKEWVVVDLQVQSKSAAEKNKLWRVQHEVACTGNCITNLPFECENSITESTGLFYKVSTRKRHLQNQGMRRQEYVIKLINMVKIRRVFKVPGIQD